ncbi:DUF5819 family protein [Planomonospora algeriensis]
MRKRFRRTIVALAVTIAGTLFTAHAAMTFLFVSPDNYLGIAGRSLVESYMRPVFGQNWQLFSPDPVESDMGMLVRANLAGPSGKKSQTQFLDVTSLNLDKVLHSPVPDRTARMASTILTLYTQQVSVMRRELAEEDRARAGLPAYAPDEPVTVSAPADFEPTSEELKRTNPGMRQTILQMRRVLAHIAVKAAEAHWGEEVTAVQIRVVRHEFPRFSQRANPDVGEIRHWTLGWWPTAEAKS